MAAEEIFKTKKTPKVIFRMVTHNSEATVSRAAESVLNQTYSNLELHIAVRASTDSTADIAGEYAAKDPRVRVIINKQAFEYDEGNDIKDYYHEYDVDNDYVCFMDGDDEYKTDFLEIMLPFAEENNLDIAACGKDVINVETGTLYKTTKSDDILIIDGDGFDTKFPEYYNYMRTRWGKLYRLSLIKKLDRSRIFWLFYSDDTVEVLEYYRNANRAGIYPGAFYKWYCSGGSLSYKWDERRIASDRTIYELSKRYLLDKTGQISTINNLYLCAVHVVAVTETIDVLIEAPISPVDKLAQLHDIMTDRYTAEVLSGLSITQRLPAVNELINMVSGWIVANEQEINSDKCMMMISEILAVIETA